MKRILPVHILLALSPMIGLLMGVLLQPAALDPASLYWQVQITLYKDQPPLIEHVQLVQAVEPLRVQPGDSVIQLLSARGDKLFIQTFQPVFSSGELQGGTGSISYILTLPDHPQAVQIVLQTPQGEASYDLPR